jgi:hypothetical protein
MYVCTLTVGTAEEGTSSDVRRFTDLEYVADVTTIELTGDNGSTSFRFMLL